MAKAILLLPVFFLLSPMISSEAADRPRLAVLTDIGGDPDDQQSMVRLMAYANEFEIEALIATAAGTRGELKESIVRPDLILEAVAAYEQVLPNLKKHAGGWPEADALRQVVKRGSHLRERKHIGEGKNTEASRWLVERINAGTAERPLNISIWGGQTDLGQALWQVKKERGSDGLAAFVKKFRVYDIADQDGIAEWLLEEFPGMYYILAKAPEGRDRREGTFRGMYLTGDISTTSRDWIGKHILNTGPLGALYPTKTWTEPNPHGCLKEGDTPSWFFFLPTGGNDPRDPTKPGWGGTFQKSPDGTYRDIPLRGKSDPRESVSRCRPAFQEDFAKRMSWCLPK
jgi:hypothetical protein